MEVSMNYKRIIPSTLLTALFIFSSSVTATTPSNVYQAVEQTVANIKAIRANQSIKDSVREPGIQVAKTPLHVYTKGMELFEKIQRVKTKLSLSAESLPQLPSSNVSPADVLGLVTKINASLDDIKQHMSVTITDEFAFVDGKTPSDVYEHVWRASLLMDDLAGQINPSYVFRNTEQVIAGLQKIASSMNRPVSIPEIELVKGATPLDANIEGYKVLYQLISLERKLAVKPLRVSSFPAGKITPSDVYDTTNNILAELTRINIKLDLPVIAQASLSNEKKTPSDVLGQLKKIQSILDQLI